MFIFYSTLKRPEIVLKPLKVDKDGDVLQQPIHAKFEDRVFKTDSEEIAQSIRKLPNFNADYYEVSDEASLPKGAGYGGNTVGIRKMDTPTSEVKDVPQTSQEVTELKQQVDTISQQIADLAKIVSDGLQPKKKAKQPTKQPEVADTEKTPEEKTEQD